MSTPRWASIDVGTNSVLLTIVERHADGTCTPIVEAAEITRIGEGLAAHGCFQAGAMERTASVLDRYAALCREHTVTRLVAVGTAAFRKAANASVFVDNVRNRCGLALEIISGEREAALSYHAAARDFGADCVVLDIGGGSTEFIWRTHDRLHTHSLPLGSVTLHEQLVRSDPISAADYAAVEHAIAEQMAQLPTQDDTTRPLVALAGTATTLAAMHLRLATYSHDEVHGTVLQHADVVAVLEPLRHATMAVRQRMPGLEAARADVILPGTMILLAAMQRAHAAAVTISDRGVRWGLLYELGA